MKILGIKDGIIKDWMRILFEFLFVFIGGLLVLFVKKQLYPKVKEKALRRQKQNSREKRNPEIDIARGLLIFLMLVGHFNIDPVLRVIIYSCHMVAFVVLSGYFYKKNSSLKKGISHIIKTFLRPYLFCFILNVLLDIPKWSGTYFWQIFKKYVLGMSFSGRFFTEAESVGPIYFILLLFIVRLVYMLVDHFIHSGIMKWGVILLLTVLGIGLGHFRIWLPWSIDVALYCMIFYQLGITLKERNLVEYITNQHWMYFILTIIWTYVIYKGGMEIAIRNYGNHHTYGLVIIGALSGTLVFLRLAAYISKTMFFSSHIWKRIGEASLIILIVHVIIQPLINQLLLLFLSKDYLPFMICSIFMQILLGVFLYWLVECLKKRFTKRIS